MKRFFWLGLVGLLLAGCNIRGGEQPLFITPPVMPTIVPVNNTAVSSTPASKCQSHLIGRVVDAENQVVKDVVVDIASTSVTARATSDENGRYGFAGLCAATFRVTVTAPGQPPRALPDGVAVDGANTIQYDIALK